MIERTREETGTIEKVDKGLDWYNKEINMPHRAVVRETAQSTKGRAVYDNSTKAIF